MKTGGSLERNLHDGAQIRLATLAMDLGMAREKLGADGEMPDIAAVRAQRQHPARYAPEAGGMTASQLCT